MKTKTEQAINLFNSGNLAGALKLFKNFKFGFTKEEIRILQIAYETLTGNSAFYKQIQLDTDTIVCQAIQIITSKYKTLKTA